MNFFVIRNNKQREELIAIIKNYRLPFKGVLQDIYPHRSLDYNAYYWGVLLKILSDELGYIPRELHEFLVEIRYKKENFFQKIKGIIKGSKVSSEELHMFFKGTKLLQYRPDKNGIWNLRVVSTTELDQVEFGNYCLWVRSYAMINWGINLPLPNEVIIND